MFFRIVICIGDDNDDDVCYSKVKKVQNINVVDEDHVLGIHFPNDVNGTDVAGRNLKYGQKCRGYLTKLNAMLPGSASFDVGSSQVDKFVKIEVDGENYYMIESFFRNCAYAINEKLDYIDYIESGDDDIVSFK